MKTGRMVRNLLLVLTVAASVLMGFCTQSAADEVRYNLTLLPTLGGTRARAEFVSDDGLIVGGSTDAAGREFAVAWENLVPRKLPVPVGTEWSFARDVNADGDIVGWLRGSGPEQMAIWRDDGTVTIVGGISAGLYGHAINDSGKVAMSGVNVFRPYTWDPTNGTQTLPTLGGAEGEAYYLNSAGKVIGWTDDPSGNQRACLWDETGAHDVGDLGGDFSVARDIDDLDRIVGWSELDNGDVRPFLCTTPGSLQDLGSLGGHKGRGRAINAAGQIVGSSETGSGIDHAYIWENGVMTDLNELIPEDDRWVLKYGRMINDGGSIAGFGTFDGYESAFLLTPVPEPATMLLLGTALVGAVGMLRRRGIRSN